MTSICRNCDNGRTLKISFASGAEPTTYTTCDTVLKIAQIYGIGELENVDGVYAVNVSECSGFDDENQQ